jgi:hypothetical protein
VNGGLGGIWSGGAARRGPLARYLLRLGAAGITRMNMTTKGRTVFRRTCELTGTKSARGPDQVGDQALIEVTSAQGITIKVGGSSLFSEEWGQQRPLPPAHASAAPPEPPRSTSDLNQRYYGEAPARPAGRSGAGLVEYGATGSAVWRAKRGSERSPRRGNPAKGESRGTVWRLLR